MLQAGFSRQVITPVRGVSLAGYFNERPNKGVLDDIYVKAAIFKKDDVVTGMVSFELASTTLRLVNNVKDKLKAKGYDFADNLLMAATHTHTGPEIRPNKGGLNDQQFALLEDKAVIAIEEAYANLMDSTIEAAKVNNNPCAFNRRYWMKDGCVQTNPGKLNPNIDRPEGPVDDEISVIAVKQEGRIAALLTNIVNHNDTVSGDLVSGEWPSRMERTVQQAMNYDVPVIELHGCSGNINHFDVSTDMDQTSYAEACRIGKAYGEIVLGLIDSLEPVEVEQIEVISKDFEIPFQVISEDKLSEAKATVERLKNVSSDENLTSEGIAAGDGAVAKMFAEQVINFSEQCSGKSRTFKLMHIKMGKDLMFVSTPGEAFTEAGLDIKSKSPYKYNFVVSYAMGSCGYMCMPECYSRGGYEILPVIHGGPREDSITRLMDEWNQMVNG